MGYSIRFKNSSKNDLRKIKNSPLRKKFDEIVKKLAVNPYDVSDNFEKLFPPENKLYSRRLNIQHRIVYSVDEQRKIVHIYSAWNHYE